MGGARPVVTTRESRADFAAEVVRFLAHLSDEGPVGVSLSLPFGLSATMRRHGLGLDETISAVESIRAALLSVSGLDTATEPVPLRVPDRVLFVLNLAVYLDGLLGRAARTLGVSRGEAADVTVELLGSN
ncbi:MAG: hypothetical protein ABSD97_16775 [Acidimicrobiales bacterium]